MDDRDQRIREAAYRLWEEEGRPDGRADEHWRRALELHDAEEAMTHRSDPPLGRDGETVSPLPTAVLETRSAAAPAEPIRTGLAAGEERGRQNAAPLREQRPADAGKVRSLRG